MKKNFYKVVEECYDYENEIEKPSGIEGSLNFSTLLEKVLASSKNSNWYLYMILYLYFKY